DHELSHAPAARQTAHAGPWLHRFELVSDSANIRRGKVSGHAVSRPRRALRTDRAPARADRAWELARTIFARHRVGPAVSRRRACGQHRQDDRLDPLPERPFAGTVP